MSIDHDHPTVLHPAWCAPDAHDYVGPYDSWHRSEVRTVDLIGSLPGDLDGIEITVDQHNERPGGVGAWRPGRVAIILRALRDGGSELTGHEARRVARELLAAADIADGVAVAW